jgi:hypothetical protein
MEWPLVRYTVYKHYITLVQIWKNYWSLTCLVTIVLVYKENIFVSRVSIKCLVSWLI